MTRLAIMIGGAAGAVARHGVSMATAACCAPILPWGTLAVNLAGSWALGLFMAVLPATSVTPAVRAGLTIGLCGGVTTFSTFSLEALTLARTGQTPLAAVYVAASVLLAISGILAGLGTGAWLMRPDRGRAASPPPGAEGRPRSRHPRQSAEDGP
jgi:fluoride exporter